MRCVFDLEANGLLQRKLNKKGEVKSEPATKIHCGVFKDIRSGQVWVYRPDELEEMLALLKRIDLLIGHNIVDYDIPLLESILDYKYEGEVFDTYTVSQMTYPDRPGGHGLDNWGKALGRHKPVHEDWSKYSDDMLHRCKEDVEINYLVYRALKKELHGYCTGLDFTVKNRT